MHTKKSNAFYQLILLSNSTFIFYIAIYLCSSLLFSFSFKINYYRFIKNKYHPLINYLQFGLSNISIETTVINLFLFFKKIYNTS
jgi:hypothetical protein